MPTAPKPVPAASEFSRPLRVEALRESSGGEFSGEAEAGELSALARRFGVEAVRALSYRARLTPKGDGWTLEGEVTARLEQICVVTLEPMTVEIRERLEREFQPGAPLPTATHEVEIVRGDEPDALGAEIDVAEIAAEAAALAVDPWPRRDDAAFEGRLQGPPGAEALTDEAARPFAALAALRHRMKKP